MKTHNKSFQRTTKMLRLLSTAELQRSVHKMKAVSVLAFVVLISSCGFLHGPGYSMNDRDYFMESPKIINSGAIYKLVWRYGEMGFYFAPRCIVTNNELLCSLQGTSSSGELRGKYGEVMLGNSEEIKAIQSGKAFWLEPNGKRVAIEVINA